MSHPHLSLNVLEVPSPCAVPWRAMAGDDRVRFCGQCRKDVYNLSAMTATEAESLLRNGGDGPCVRFYRRFDGTVVTTDRCGNRAARAWRRFATTVGAMLVALASLTGCDCSKLGMCTQGKPAGPRPATVNPPPPADEPDEDDDSDPEEGDRP
jgi:hypothetical protein